MKRAKGGHEVVLIGVAGWQQEEASSIGSDLGALLSLLELGLDLGALRLGLDLGALLRLVELVAVELAKSCAALTLALSAPV